MTNRLKIFLSALSGLSFVYSQPDLKILNLNRTDQNNGYYHVSLPAGNAMLDSLATANNWEMVGVTGPEKLNSDTLPTYDLLIFHNAFEDPLTEDERGAIETHVQSGKGIVAIHSGTFLWKNWAWWVDMMGGLRHTGGYGRRVCEVTRTDTTHLSTKNNPDLYHLNIEWYHFDGEVFNEGTHVLETSTMTDSVRAIEPPIEEPIEGPTTWCKHFDGGRAWMTQHGHFDTNYQNPIFAGSVYGAILWASDENAGGCGRPVVSLFRFDKKDRHKVLQSLQNPDVIKAYNVLGQKINSFFHSPTSVGIINSDNSLQLTVNP